MKLATNVGKKELLSLGVCFGKFTKTKKFTLHMTCLDYLAQYATHDIPLGTIDLASLALCLA